METLLLNPSAIMVSRKHAQDTFVRVNDFILKDNKSFNSTLLNKQRISAPTPIYHNDKIQLGHGGPILHV